MFWFSSKYKIYAYTEKAFNENNHSFMIKKKLFRKWAWRKSTSK